MKPGSDIPKQLGQKHNQNAAPQKELVQSFYDIGNLI
jgi:hypothetical protein